MEGAVDQASLRQRAYVNEAGSGFRGRSCCKSFKFSFVRGSKLRHADSKAPEPEPPA